MENNIDLFNEYTAAIFAKLYEAFPVPCALDALAISGTELLDDGLRMEPKGDLCFHTMHWLVDAGYIRTGDHYWSYGLSSAVLTAKGLELLKLVPSSLEEQISLGDKLLQLGQEGVKTAGKELTSLGMTEFFRLFLA